MVKLVQNLETRKLLVTTKNGQLKEIRWKYIDSLKKLQQEPAFSYANKLKTKSIHWKKHEMNVSLATQTMSASVVSVVDFLINDLSAP